MYTHEEMIIHMQYAMIRPGMCVCACVFMSAFLHAHGARASVLAGDAQACVSAYE